MSEPTLTPVSQMSKVILPTGSSPSDAADATFPFSVYTSDQFFFFIGSLLFFDQCLGVCFSSLFHEIIDSLLLLLGHHLVFLLHPFDVGKKLHSLLISDFLLLHPLHWSFLDLIDDNLGTLLSGFVLSNISFLFFLENL